MSADAVDASRHDVSRKIPRATLRTRKHSAVGTPRVEVIPTLC